MKKILLKTLVSATFIVALALSININSNKETKDSGLLTIHSAANAACENPFGGWGGGRCSEFGDCYGDAGNTECDPWN